MNDVTIIMPVSREHYLNRIFAQLELLKCDRDKTNLLTYVDGPLQLYQKTHNLTVNSKFNERLCVYRKKGQPSVGSVRRRRQRIADIHNEIKQYVQKSEYLFLIEDDTLFPINALAKLLGHYSIHQFAGLISAIELGRWGYAHIGAWEVDDIYEPKKIVSIEYEKGFRKVDATGLYCCLTKMENYMNHKFAPVENVLGPDVNFGIYLRKEGLKNYVDQSIKCTHMSKSGDIRFLNRTVVRVKLEKQGNKWLQSQID